MDAPANTFHAPSAIKRPLLLLSLAFSLFVAAVDIRGLSAASAEERCLVADPTGTPLNVRTAPDARVMGTLSNGTRVKVFDRSSVGGRSWVYVGRYEDNAPLGWVYRDYLDCRATNHASPSRYVVDGLALGGHVRFESDAYSRYRCNPSDKFPGFTWCHKRGEAASSASILHSQDGTALYVNRYIEPAFFRQNEVQNEIQRLSARFAERAHVFRMASRQGLPNAVIAVWGDIKLEQLDAAGVSLVAAGKTHQGLLVSFLGDLKRSAIAGVPVYRLSGGAGFLWAAAFNKDGRGVLRFLAIDAAQIERGTTQPKDRLPESAAPTSPHGEESGYAKIEGWSIRHEDVNNLSVCSATAQFMDQTVLQLAMVQKDGDKAWAILIANPRWHVWVAQRSQHRLALLTTKSLNENFNVSDDKETLVLTDASINFIGSLADGGPLKILADNKEQLTSLNMSGVDSAIKEVINCAREHPPEPRANAIFYGTAFFVAPNLLLTNNHVVEQCTGPIQVRYPDKASYPATVSGTDKTNDLALLHTQVTNLSVGSFRLQLRLGDQIAAYGFPYPNILSPDGNFTVGNVSSSSGPGEDAHHFQISAPIQPGNSGGPVLDTSGRVVGVVVARLNEKSVSELPQNVNFAIQMPTVINFLSVKGVAPQLDTSNAARPLPSWNDVADLAKQFTVQVSCEGRSQRTSNSE